MLVILGDIHFRDDKPWCIEVCKAFLNWFENWDLNNENNTLLLAGDLVEKNLLTGFVADYLEKFWSLSKFKAIHICVGNHDLKTVNDRPQLAYEFYRNKPNVFIYLEATETIIEGKKVLFLPYYTDQNRYGYLMSDYYSNISTNPLFTNNYDLVLGHFSGPDAGFEGSTDVVKNLDKINTKKICLGHIHIRDCNPSVYIGSVYAGKKGENDLTRAAWYLDGDTWKEQKLPVFNEFLMFSYPNDLPDSRALIPIYTILNCGSELVAKEKYGDIFIRRISADMSDTVTKTLAEFDEQFLSVKSMNKAELFDAFLKTREVPVDVISECKTALGIA